MSEKLIHWKSSLSAINPASITEDPARITGTRVHETRGEVDLLTLFVERTRDHYHQDISYFAIDMLGDGECEEGTPKVIRDLYADFGVASHRELIEREVTALYYAGRYLVAVRRST